MTKEKDFRDEDWADENEDISDTVDALEWLNSQPLSSYSQAKVEAPDPEDILRLQHEAKQEEEREKRRATTRFEREAKDLERQERKAAIKRLAEEVAQNEKIRIVRRAKTTEEAIQNDSSVPETNHKKSIIKEIEQLRELLSGVNSLPWQLRRLSDTLDSLPQRKLDKTLDRILFGLDGIAKDANVKLVLVQIKDLKLYIEQIKDRLNVFSQVEDANLVANKTLFQAVEIYESTKRLSEQLEKQIQYLDSISKANAISVSDIEHAIAKRLSESVPTGENVASTVTAILNKLDAQKEQISILNRKIGNSSSFEIPFDLDRRIRDIEASGKRTLGELDSLRASIDSIQLQQQNNQKKDDDGVTTAVTIVGCIAFVVGALIGSIVG